jgi:hypothetical protein
MPPVGFFACSVTVTNNEQTSGSLGDIDQFLESELASSAILTG